MSNNNENRENKRNNIQKVILCACKKYMKNQKNGILFICFENEYNSDNSKYYFYNTGNFEVYCFCPLSLNIENENKYLDKDNKIIETNYFLVGGFDINRKKGMIKLYRINYGKNYNNTTIEYIENLKIKDNKDNKDKKIKFKEPISCIIHMMEN